VEGRDGAAFWEERETDGEVEGGEVSPVVDSWAVGYVGRSRNGDVESSESGGRTVSGWNNVLISE